MINKRKITHLSLCILGTAVVWMKIPQRPGSQNKPLFLKIYPACVIIIGNRTQIIIMSANRKGDHISLVHGA
jgi:hypothetical protein